MLLTSSDTERNWASILVKVRPERTSFNMYAEYTTAINFPCITPLLEAFFFLGKELILSQILDFQPDLNLQLIFQLN